MVQKERGPKEGGDGRNRNKNNREEGRVCDLEGREMRKDEIKIKVKRIEKQFRNKKGRRNGNKKEKKMIKDMRK